jgi:hypothetical protein
MVMISGCSGSEEKKAETKAPAPTAQEVKKDIKEAAGATAAYTKEQLDQARTEATNRLAAMDKDIDALQAKAAGLSDQAKAQAQKTLDDLKARRGEAAAKLDALKAAGQDAGKGLKDGYDAAMDSLAKAYEAAKKSLEQ